MESVASKLDLSQILSHPLVQNQNRIALQHQSSEMTNQAKEQLKPQENCPDEPPVGSEEKRPALAQVTNQTASPMKPSQADIQAIRRGSVISQSSLKLSRRNSRAQVHTPGLYNSELPSPRPNVLLPNFSISPYAESRRSNSWRDYE